MICTIEQGDELQSPLLLFQCSVLGCSIDFQESFFVIFLHYHVSFWGVSAIVKAGSSSITGITRLLIPVMVTKIVPFRDCEINWFLMKKMNLDFNWQLYCLSQTLNQIFYYLGIPVHLRLLKQWTWPKNLIKLCQVSIKLPIHSEQVFFEKQGQTIEFYSSCIDVPAFEKIETLELINSIHFQWIWVNGRRAFERVFL